MVQAYRYNDDFVHGSNVSNPKCVYMHHKVSYIVHTFVLFQFIHYYVLLTYCDVMSHVLWWTLGNIGDICVIYLVRIYDGG